MANTKDMQKALEALEGLPPSTTAAKIRALYPAIEAKVAEGVQHAAILEALNAAGIEVSMATYKGTLQRIRKEHAEGRRQMPDAPAPEPSAPPPTEPAPPGAPETAPGSAADDQALTPRQRRERKSSQYVSDKRKPRFPQKEGSK